MNQHLQEILNFITHANHLSAEERASLIKAVTDADSELTISEFNLERTEKVKRATAILLEETIEELEQKRKAVGAQNHELEIESSLERVRTVAMSMQKTDDVLNICKIIFAELQSLGFEELRNVLINFWNDEDRYLLDYDYSDFTGANIAHLPYNNHRAFEKFQERIRSAKDAFAELIINEDELASWKERRRKDGEYEDPRLDDITALYYYFYSIEVGAVGISTFSSLSEDKLKLIRRFRNVFDLAYRRYIDIEKAEAQAKEARIETALEKVRSRSLAMHASDEIKEVALTVLDKITELGIEMNGGISLVTFVHASKDIVHWLTIGPDFFNVHLPYFDHIIFKECDGARENGMELFAGVYSGEVKASYFKYLMEETGFSAAPQELKDWVNDQPYFGFSFAIQKHSGIFLNDYTGKYFSKETNNILIRFSKVFEQAYTRFLDLQKAEAQAREAQIEAALERVRSRSMAMHKSEELVEVVWLMDSEIAGLGVKLDNTTINIDFSFKENGFNVWIAARGKSYLEKFHIPYSNRHDRVSENLYKAIEDGLDYYTDKYSKAEKNKFFKWLFKYSDFRKLPEERKQFVLNTPGWTRATVVSKNSILIFQQYKLKEFTEEESGIFKRFGKVFEQAYTRCLDLQKAEAQARESQIQLALERARTQSMIMQHSNELDETLRVFHEQVLHLGIPSAFSFLWLPDEAEDRHIFWAAWEENKSFKSKAIDYPLDRNEPATALCLTDWKGNVPVVAYHVPPPSVQDYFAAWGELIAGVDELKPENFSDGLYYVEAFMKYGCFGVMVKNTLLEDEKKILHRFAVEFERAYTRFLDLQKAEAQAREAQIEAALERVRSRSMGMQKSEELKDVIKIVYQQLKHLNLHLAHAGFVVDYTPGGDWHFWIADEQVIPSKITHPYFDSVWANQFSEAKEKGADFFTTNLNFEEKNKFYNRLLSYIPGLPEASKDFYLTCPGLAATTVLFDNVSLYIENFEGIVYTDEENKMLMRFGKVFQQTYTRFLDLQKAEAQAREAEIELGLERVRARAMAMQKSDDLAGAVAIIFEELEKLNTGILRCGLGIINKENRSVNVWTTSKSDENTAVHISGDESMDGHPLLQGAFNAWLKQEEYSYVLHGKDLTDYYKAQKAANFKLPDSQSLTTADEDLHQFYFLATFQAGGLFAFRETEFSQQAKNVMKRFAGVFNLTYKRFLDLQKAEAQALEAIKRSSVDRVRAEIASMRTTSDLERIQPLIWNELKTLGVPFIRCGVFIMDEEKQEVQAMLSTPEGKAIATLHVPFEFDITIITNGVQYWRKMEVYNEHWDADAFNKNWNKLASLRQTFMDSPQTERPPESLYLHMLPFLQGMLYVGNVAPLKEDELQLVQNLAGAFSSAYARYEDFNKLEAAKKQVDNTLNELQATQKQLIQSEKMASLGELTAGIAHEIQNPLNFVNNFSEVNSELIDELSEEVNKGNLDEVKSIVKDIKENEQKINHHGKRADAIVKNMLQHSRSSSSQREPTNINALADEYLRLSYHGMRARDKLFNATIQTDFDDGIDEINIIPQDIGRVLLNLYNNAFYAVNEKKKNPYPLKGQQEYEPTVTVITKSVKSPSGDLPAGRQGLGVLIYVADNGNGVPQNAVDKIFQPFFTTKPTGQGTGLGLSLSYDIVKAHGGEIKVTTKDGEGTEFIISLPVV